MIVESGDALDESATLAVMLSSDGAEGTTGLADRDPGADLEAAIEEVREPARGVHVSVGDVESDPPGVASHIGAKVRRHYLAGLTRCYAEAHEAHELAGGKVGVGFTVDVRGRTQRPDVTGFDDVVDACIGAQVGRWRFRAPEDEDGNPTATDVYVPLTMRPR